MDLKKLLDDLKLTGVIEIDKGNFIRIITLNKENDYFILKHFIKNDRMKQKASFQAKKESTVLKFAEILINN